MSPEEFTHEFGPEFTPPTTHEYGPYGQPTQAVKTGLTRRGKAAMAISVTVLAGGGLLTWQHYSAEAQASQVKAQELSIQQQQLELEKLKVLGQVNEKTAKAQAIQDAARQKQIDACVSDSKGLVGKQLGATYSSVLSDCQAQYAATSTGTGMQEAASSTDTSSGGGISPSLLVGIVAGGGLLVAVAANRNRKSYAA